MNLNESYDVVTSAIYRSAGPSIMSIRSVCLAHSMHVMFLLYSSTLQKIKMAHFIM